MIKRKSQKIIIKNRKCFIHLNENKIAFCNIKDYNLIKNYHWVLCKYPKNKFYLKTKINNKNTSIHRLILNIKNPKILVDHIDGNGLNNLRNNLRICNHQTNSFNQDKYRINKSGYKGVYWSKLHKKWRASIRISNRAIHLGLFGNLKQASKAYIKASKKYHKEFSYFLRKNK